MSKHMKLLMENFNEFLQEEQTLEPGHPLYRGSLSKEEHDELIAYYAENSPDDPEMPIEVVLHPIVVKARSKIWEKIALSCNDVGVEDFDEEAVREKIKRQLANETIPSQIDVGNNEQMQGLIDARLSRMRIAHMRTAGKEELFSSCPSALRHMAKHGEQALEKAIAFLEHNWRKGNWWNVYGDTKGSQLSPGNKILILWKNQKNQSSS